ncbi:MAG: DNA-directed RNA polymerase subunit beta' [Candidatus Firestonebacteria bacterium]|nr:DNA-directed RNA polymerase subunit beta' [Candidatus Firestonebacteria bacterium]
MPELFKKERKIRRFVSISIGLASPEMIRKWSFGEVKKPETINYRTFKPEKDGLFCERIFGPVKDWECNCGKYKRIKYKGVICDRCGVEVTQSKVRRERMGHIELAAPVSHIWYFKGLPSRIGNLLNLSLNSLERVLYYENYIVVDPGPAPVHERQLLNEDEYRKYADEYGEKFIAKMGAGAVKELLKEMNLDSMAKELRKELKESNSLQKRKKVAKRLKVVESFRKSQNRPEWMILDVVPVIPAELRPLVPLDGGRFATSDLNDLYRRVINRNNRLKKLISLKAPDVIIRNEKRMLQEAVDALFDNGRRGRAVKGSGNRPLKSLSSMLKGKQGRFRQNLLGKRVDYSGRSVIVVGPELKMNQCGLPKKMALELFKPFIIKKLDEKGYVSTIKGAKKIVESERPEVWDILEEVIRSHCVLLNRAPTLHRLGIQSFEPILIEGKAIQVHPLVCTAFNADFDGDQMAVHVPLSIEAQSEARLLMYSIYNLLSPSNGSPITTPTQDIVLGISYLTCEKVGEPGEGTIFPSSEHVILAYELKKVGKHASIKVKVKNEIIQTTVGRIIFNDILPPEMPFFNERVDKKSLLKLVSMCFRMYGQEKTAQILDSLKKLGFEEATKAGISIAINDIKIPYEKDVIVKKATNKVNIIEAQYKKGIITDGERHNKIVDIWTHVTEEISDIMFNGLKPKGIPNEHFNPIFMMADSGARGSKQQIRQLAGMRGLMAKPSGEIIESPITANFREGLTVLEYFISTHGARKGLADTALKTADSGYLTRRLVDVAQDVIITELDCGTLNGIVVGAIKEGEEVIESIKDRVLGRVALDNIVDIISDEVICHAGQEITEEIAGKIEEAGIEKIKIRSVLTCEIKRGVCAKCYGRNLTTGRIVDYGEAVGVIAAQSIGEPGTQLTMRTFHIGGTASKVIEQSKAEARNSGKVKFINLKVLNKKDGNIIALSRQGRISIVSDAGRELEKCVVTYGAIIRVKDGQSVNKGDLLIEWDSYNTMIISEVEGKIVYKDIIEGVTMREELDKITGLRGRLIVPHKEENLLPQILLHNKKGDMIASYPISTGAHLIHGDGDLIEAGEILAKIPRETSKTKDITGGLPRVAELFEARKPKECAIITEIDGIVNLGDFVKGMRKVIIKNEETGMEKEYLIPHGKHLSVRDGDRVIAGDQLMDGPLNPHDILRVKGEAELQQYLVNEIQEVYRLQGVNTNDKHIEVIVRQMLRKVKITEPGDTYFLPDDEVDKFEFKEENERVIAKNGKPAEAKTVLLGITKASLRTESFISAASFQETTRVLTEAAVCGKRDELHGLKENVIVGNLIPAGTGMSYYRDIEIQEKQ